MGTLAWLYLDRLSFERLWSHAESIVKDSALTRYQFYFTTYSPHSLLNITWSGRYIAFLTSVHVLSRATVLPPCHNLSDCSQSDPGRAKRVSQPNSATIATSSYYKSDSMANLGDRCTQRKEYRAIARQPEGPELAYIVWIDPDNLGNLVIHNQFRPFKGCPHGFGCHSFHRKHDIHFSS